MVKALALRANCCEQQHLSHLSVALGLLLSAHATAQWTQVATTGPAVRQGAAMAYDSPRARTVLFGGSAGATGILVADTWEWDGFAWLPQLLAFGPSARSQSAMAYDSQRGRTVLFGGYAASGPYGDTWEWNGNTWSLMATTGPPPRNDHAMVYDSLRGRTVLFGGSASGAIILTDTWEWDGSAWTQAAATGPLGQAPAMAFDSRRARTVLFVGALGATWEWNGTAWSSVASSGPSIRLDPALTYDTQRERSLLFGGGLAGSDTWEWDGSNWIQIATAGPSPRQNHAMVYEGQRGVALMFGGYQHPTGNLGDTWAWSANGGALVYGFGCGTSPLSLSPVPNALPVINATAQVSLASIPSSLAFVALGWSRTAVGPFPLPLTLAGYGMQGCELLQSAEAAAQPVTFTGVSVANYGLALPNWIELVGLRICLQGWAHAPGANAGNTIVSNGVEWTIGL